MTKLTGKVAIVTGASRGIGAGIAARLAADGASVIVNYAHSKDDADLVVHEIRAAGGAAYPIKANLSRPIEIDSLVGGAVRRFGSLDILVNNAGMYALDSLDTLTADSFDAHFNLNVRGLLLATQAAAKVLPPGGVVVNISSILAKRPMPTAHVYCATKGAVDTLTRSLAMELGPRRVRVIGISPGFVATEGSAEWAWNHAPAVVSRTPLGRAGQPRDIAAAVSYAVSEDAAWVTGTTIDVSGGLIF